MPLIAKKKSSSAARYGIAFDVGTTTIAAAIADTKKREIIASATVKNPLREYGSDVISLIKAASRSNTTFLEMRLSLYAGLKTAAEELLAKNKIKMGSVGSYAAAGNSVIEHFLHGFPPALLGKAPYKCAFKESSVIPVPELQENRSLYLFPLIGAFAGGDAVAVALSLGMDKTEKNILAIDIGTNSEAILSKGGVISATASPAGPAFEGAEISFGMRAEKGAIDKVLLKDDTLVLQTIEGARPKGICGSGLVSIAALLIEQNIIDPTGRIKDKDEVSTNLSSRIIKGKGGNDFLLYKSALNEIRLTQSDVRALQTAKASIRASVEMLIKKAGLEADGIDGIYLAGAFGANLDKNALTSIGLLDKAWYNKVKISGDAALEGAVMALYSIEYKMRAADIAKGTKYVPLSGSKQFEKAFLKHMGF